MPGYATGGAAGRGGIHSLRLAPHEIASMRLAGSVAKRSAAMCHLSSCSKHSRYRLSGNNVEDDPSGSDGGGLHGRRKTVIDFGSARKAWTAGASQNPVYISGTWQRTSHERRCSSQRTRTAGRHSSADPIKDLTRARNRNATAG